VVAGAALSYVAGVLRLRARGTGWPLPRLSCWLVGWACVGAALAGPLAGRAHHDFTAHMATHLMTGMVAPLLLVSAAPVTLLLRVLPVARARATARVLASWPVAVVTHPVTAAVLNVGGLWVLYRTDLYTAAAGDPWLHLVVAAHVVAGGYLFVFAVLAGPDPAPHRAPAVWRAGTLIAATAAHNILAKLLYADPPAGVPVEQAQQASQLMYYGGAPAEIALIILCCRTWLGRRSRQPRRDQIVPRGLSGREPS
jgi:putative membrane protein